MRIFSPHPYCCSFPITDCLYLHALYPRSLYLDSPCRRWSFSRLLPSLLSIAYSFVQLATSFSHTSRDRPWVVVCERLQNRESKIARTKKIRFLPSLDTLVSLRSLLKMSVTPHGKLLVRGSINIDGTLSPSLISSSDVFDLIFALPPRLEFFVVDQ